MLLGAGIDTIGTGALIGGVVTLFGVATTLLIKVGDRSETRYQGEIDRLREDKDATIVRLEAERDKALADRDVWFRLAAEAKGLRTTSLDVAPTLPGAGLPPSAADQESP